VPLGFFAVASARRRSQRATTRSIFLGAVLLGGVLSLGIELIQVELPARVSSATDLACNLLGTIAGAGLAWRGPLARRLFGSARRTGLTDRRVRSRRER
jgi:glycopeptide antibiotics resistance protein